MVLYCIVASALWAASGDVQVETLDGQVKTGRLVALGADGATLDIAGQRDVTEANKLLAVSATKPEKPRTSARITVELADRSRLAVTDYKANGGTAHLTLAGGNEANVPTQLINWVRFEPPGQVTEKLARQWAEMLDSKPVGDLIVVRKKGSIDYLAGKLGEFDEDGVKFVLDGETRTVPLVKIEGMVFYRAKELDLPDPTCYASDIYGSVLHASRVSLEDGRLKINTPVGLVADWRMENLAKLDYSESNVQYLSDLDPESSRYTPIYVLPKELPSVTEYFKPRRDVGFNQAPLQLDGKPYTKGLALASRTALRYRLPGKFRVFRAVAGIDDSVRPGGNVRVQIKGDGKTLWESVVKGTEKPRPLELDVVGVKRLEVLVDFGDDLDVADRFDLCEARVTK